MLSPRALTVHRFGGGLDKGGAPNTDASFGGHGGQMLTDDGGGIGGERVEAALRWTMATDRSPSRMVALHASM
jgi:hypothetical protein